MRRLFLILANLLFLIFLSSSSCSDKLQCKTNKDCLAGTFCDVPNSTCVQCLDNSNCDEDDFCCAGQCRAVSQQDKYCGCAASALGAPGQDCQKIYRSGESKNFGPICQIAGEEEFDASKISEASCGCTENSAESEECGTNSDGLKNFCDSQFKCQPQSAESCGADKHKCTPASGGPACLIADAPVYGQCGCKTGNNAGCEVTVDGHKVADSCVANADGNEKCICAASGAVCKSKTDNTPDCCGDGCTNLLTDQNNCGTCAHKCPQITVDGTSRQGSCIAGACECGSTDHCKDNELVSMCINHPTSQNWICVCQNYSDATGPSACPIGYVCSGNSGCCKKSDLTDCKTTP